MIVIEPANLLASLAAASVNPSGGAAKLGKRELSTFVGLAAEAAGVKGQVSVLLTDDPTIRGLNRLFRKKDKSTDVLSFPAGEQAGGRKPALLAGDLAISLETAARQAQVFGHPLQTEVKVLLLHGLLHLAGLDHEIDSGQMAKIEAALRAQFGLPLGLIQRTEATTKKVARKKQSGVEGKKRSLPALAARLRSPRP